MPVAIALGGDPMVTYCATLPLPPSVNEFWFAGLLRGEPVELAQCRTSGLLVPAGAEMVIEGILIPGETTPSGAFGNHTGYYAPSKDAPLLRVTAISRRRDMILPATVVGPPPMEDCWFAEATSRLLLALVQADLPFVISLDRPQAGIFHGGTIITVDSSLDKPGNGLLASLMASQFLAKARLLVMVDYGQDPHDYSGVYWRIINNSDWKRDLVIAGDRLGIDATCKPRGNIAEGVPQEHVRMARDIEQLVSQRWNEYGFK